MAANAADPTEPEITHTVPDGVLVTVINAELDDKKPGGGTWDDADSSAGLRGLVAAGATFAYTGNWGFAKLAGDVMSRDSSTHAETAPDAFVRFTIGDKPIATPIQMDTCLPSWSSPVVVRPDGSSVVTIAVLDADAGGQNQPLREDPMGTITLPAEELTKPGLKHLGPFGAVRSLVLNVSAYGKEHWHKREGIQVPGNRAWTDSGVDVIAGQVLRVRARGQIAVTSGASVGPAGYAPPKWSGFSVLKDQPHGGLLVRAGSGQPTYVGASAELLVTGSGRLMLGPNDNDIWNNSGEFMVALSVR